MMKMVFKDIYLFDPIKKVARKISFKDGINVITSNQKDGTDRGKSVIMRSMYHALGAEAYFEDKWETKNKVYILKIAIDQNEYYIYRTVDLYKFFDADKKLLFVATRSKELAENIKKYTHFSVMLPNRETNKLEITPTVYNYLPFFIDQDHYDGSNYSSFKKLGQYASFKDSVLFYHLGIYNEEYFEIKQKKEELDEKISKYKKNLEMKNFMLEDLNEKIGIDSVSTNLDALRSDLEGHRKEYEEVLLKVKRSKSKLIDLNNQLFEIESIFNDMNAFSKKTENEIKKLNKHICPECGSTISDTITLKSKRYNLEEDIISLKNDLQNSFHTLQIEIEKEEERYQGFLNEMNTYHNRVKGNSQQVNDILRYKGLCEIKDGILEERKNLCEAVKSEESELAGVEKKLKEYTKKKKDITKRYTELLTIARIKFGLNEVNPDAFKSLKKNFNASGSNKNIATVIWYLTILELRNEFNPDVIHFPTVFDSPNNVETDDEKKHALLAYILEKAPQQLIVSSIGFDPKEFPGKDIHLITLENDKYELLGTDDYVEYEGLLQELCDKE